MNLISVVDTIEQANMMKDNGISEVIVGNMLFSRFGKVSNKRYNEFTKQLKEIGLRVVFDWDILMTQTLFDQRVEDIGQIDFSNIDAIRVADPGALLWCKENFSNTPLQLILENGNHNLIGIEKWIEIAGSSLERIVLSIELSKDILKRYASQISCPIEFLVLGRILLFYTPRNLVSPYLLDHDDDKTKSMSSKYIEIEGSSEESPHKGFPIVENLHGTFMFNTKDQYLCDHVEDLKEIGITNFRFDVRHCNDLELIKKVSSQLLYPNEENSKILKSSYDRVVIRGFFHVNKSDVLFKKLKNQRTQRKDESFIGEVLDVKKKKHIALIVKSKDRCLNIGDEIVLKTPDGKIKTSKVDKIYNTSNELTHSLSKGQIGLIAHISGISVKTQIYVK